VSSDTEAIFYLKGGSMPCFRTFGVRTFALALGFCVMGAAAAAFAQGPTPETGATLFPGGAYLSYGSYFVSRKPNNPGAVALGPTARPTLEHRGQFVFSWGFRRDFQLTVIVPIVTTRFSLPTATETSGGTGLGDVVFFLKHRFYRRDSARGTTQASLSIGPKLPTGHTSLRDAAGARLPVGLQPGSGSADLFVAVNWTLTGLFNIRRLVADETVQFSVRSEGAQQMKLGNSFESRFWLTYRPYQSREPGKEWFIGPTIVWRHNWRDRLAGVMRTDSGGSALLLGVTTYVGLRPGMTAWFSADFPVVQTSSGAPTNLTRRFSFGITQQFLLPR
jgi:hypothetical protein